MRKLQLIAIASALILLATSASFATLLHEDVTYWYKSDGAIGSMMNPTSDWLAQNAADLVLKVQQSVWDQVSSASILARNGDTGHPGYLYAYSVSNLNIGDPGDPNCNGIVDFHADWATPFYATISHQTPGGWVVDSSSTGGPGWKWTGNGPGMLPGDTVGGFWAVSNVGADGECTSTVHLGALTGERTPFSGRTTGPCPEPGTFVSLFAGIAGLGLVRKLRRR